jgi:hypothetical protein
VPSESRGTGGTSGGTPSVTVTNLLPPGPQSYVLVAVAINSTAFSVTSITAGTGTFVLVAAINSTGRRMELWVGYNFGTSAPSSITVNRAAGTAQVSFITRTIDLLADCTTAPTFTATAGTVATSASADTGSLTPAVGDLLFAAVLISSTTADSTARTHTGNAYLQNNNANEITIAPLSRLETGWCEAVAAVASKEVWTLGASVEWAAIQVKWTPPAPPTPTPALLLKGMTTQAADAASSY